MSSQRFSPEFKDEAVRQVTQRGYSVVEVAKRIGVSANSLYKWVRAAKGSDAGSDELAATQLENQKLKAELRRVQEERVPGVRRGRTLRVRGLLCLPLCHRQPRGDILL
jgi:transposase